MDRMETTSNRSTGRNAHRYRSAVWAELTQTFVEPLGEVLESTGAESILGCDFVDQAKLQAILSWLYERGAEIVSVAPGDAGTDFVDPGDAVISTRTPSRSTPAWGAPARGSRAAARPGPDHVQLARRRLRLLHHRRPITSSRVREVRP